MAIINSTQVKVARTVVSTTPTANAGKVDSGNALNSASLDIGKNTVRYELIKENMGDTPDTAFAYETLNVAKIHSNSN